MTKEPMKKLVVEIEALMHKQIKQIAAEQNKSMKDYLKEALKDKIDKDFGLGFK